MPCTVKHIPIKSIAFTITKKRFFHVNILSDLFEKFNMGDVLSSTEVGLYQRI